jgi:hypothetical protein
MQNIYINALKSISKIILVGVLGYLTLLIFYAKDDSQLKVDFFILFFITIPTIILVFFNGKITSKFPKAKIIWKIYKYFYILFIILFIILLVVGAKREVDALKTQKTIDFINSKRITLDDVLGKNLPPKPNLELNNSTIAGIDANNNYIRDDVELAIFAKYPNSPKIRSAMLQYAQALQLELTQVYNSETMMATVKKSDSAYFCLGDSENNLSLDDLTEREIILKGYVLNTELRKQKNDEFYEKYMKTYTLPKEGCDIEIK